jgi:hypothetical protein
MLFIISKLEQLINKVQYGETLGSPPDPSHDEQNGVCGHQSRATGQTRLLWCYDDVCSDLRVPSKLFNRVLRERVIPRPTVRTFARGRLLNDGWQYVWLNDGFGLFAEPGARGGARQFSLDELIEVPGISAENLRKYSELNFPPFDWAPRFGWRGITKTAL